MTIWHKCDGESHITPIKGVCYRLVESQEQIATLGYVDTLEEQVLLEEMLDAVKPAYPMAGDDYHYLLKTPFRYPPLEWGSRLGSKHEASLFYAGLSVTSTLAESAYYRFVFLNKWRIPLASLGLAYRLLYPNVIFRSEFRI